MADCKHDAWVLLTGEGEWCRRCGSLRQIYDPDYEETGLWESPMLASPNENQIAAGECEHMHLEVLKKNSDGYPTLSQCRGCGTKIEVVPRVQTRPVVENLEMPCPHGGESHVSTKSCDWCVHCGAHRHVFNRDEEVDFDDASEWQLPTDTSGDLTTAYMAGFERGKDAAVREKYASFKLQRR